MYKFVITFSSLYEPGLSEFSTNADSENEALTKLYHSGHEVQHVHNVKRVG